MGNFVNCIVIEIFDYLRKLGESNLFLVSALQEGFLVGRRVKRFVLLNLCELRES